LTTNERGPDRQAAALRQAGTGASIDEVLEEVFALYANLRGYVLDEHDTVRHHLTLFADGAAIRNKRDLWRAATGSRSVPPSAASGSPGIRAIAGSGRMRACRRCTR